MRLFRFWLGQQLIHLGLAAFPDGLVKEELRLLLQEWGDEIRAITASAKR